MLDRTGGGLVALLVAALVFSCHHEPQRPEVFLGEPGDAIECTLSKLSERFSLDDPFAISVDARGPLPGERLTVQSVRVDEAGNFREMMIQKTLVMDQTQSRFCVIDPAFRARDFTRGQTGSFALQVIFGPDIWAQKRFEVEAPPAPAAVPAPEAPPGGPAGQASPGAPEQAAKAAPASPEKSPGATAPAKK